MRDKYGVAQDKYCYPASDVLINLLDIRESDILDQAEAEFTAERYRTYDSPEQPLSKFSLEHLKHLHHHLFQDLYVWAGQIRMLISPRVIPAFVLGRVLSLKLTNYFEPFRQYRIVRIMMN
ncbi:hypothetical protein NH514_07395 [Pseudoalteromonas sp. ACER1]|uniref:hypothetical protein n=1 Tax=unclassified Pseudoalteromonas TaxID=194690 RepID=UPI001F3803CF|nr:MULTISPECIES: hypothetical protein [unclassified Pseudoalteromonas]MCF2846987.1 hypothetical protein [Pseudoalteromonas sp. PAST1]MCO7210570.1 hypothetical protein [Pseudoalteromonas sp. ACER1]